MHRNSNLNFWIAIRILCSFLLALTVSTGKSNTFSADHAGKLYPVVGASGFDPVINVDGNLHTIGDATLVPDQNSRLKGTVISVALGSVRILTNSLKGNSVSFEALLKPSREIRDGYIVIQTDILGRDTDEFVIFELQALPVNEWTEINQEIPTAINWGVNQTTIHMYSGESKILLHGPKGKKQKEVRFLSKRGTAQIDLVRGNAMPRALFQVMPQGLPRKLIAESKQAFVTVEFYIESDGRVGEVNAVDYSHEELVKPVVESIKRSKYSAAYEDGKPKRILLKRRIWLKQPVAN